MAEDEWTFVPRRKAPKSKDRRQHQYNVVDNGVIMSINSHPSNTHQHAGGSGLYRASASVDGNSNGVGGNTDDVSQRRMTEEGQRRKEKERMKNDVLECLEALENQLHGGNGFAHHLITSMSTSSSYSYTDDHDGGLQRTTKKADDANEKIAKGHLNLRTIVAYGIGNFATERFQGPMLQLACLLLLRRYATDHVNNGGDKNDHSISSSLFENEQREVPIYYYEPCILPVEKELLETVFHVHVLECNDMGKRTVESMRVQHQQTQPNVDAAPPSSAIVATQMDYQQRAHTLFYMPHCPMRLYCNVLWAHWDHIFSPIAESTDSSTECNASSNNTVISTNDNKSPTLIFGNSFRTYEDRTISSEKLLDPTNGVFRIFPFAKEISIGNGSSRNSRGGRGRCSGEIIPDALRHLENAFNDCNVMSFPMQICNNNDDRRDDGRVGEQGVINKIRWPDRPKEYFASEDTENNGELK